MVVSLIKINQSSGTYVSWNWKAGTTTGIAGSPSITPTSYSFNANVSGFSIVKYEGNGIAGATSSSWIRELHHAMMIITKGLVTTAEEWAVWW